MHKRILNSLKRTGSHENGDRSQSDGDSPQANAARGVRLFCESGGPNNSGEEVLHLPTIVEAAESSPAAATEAARLIRKFLSTNNYPRAYVQYNAIMLIRILADNPGKSFTKNIDSKFVNTVKNLLDDGRDVSVQQILRETLDNFEATRPNDETLTGLRLMWIKEKDRWNKRVSMRPQVDQVWQGNYNQQVSQQQNYFSRPHRSRNTLPPPGELAQRIEEARTSAKLLGQVVATTPPTEILNNELIKEFVDRCQSAARSTQAYIHADSPPPDEATLLTLIETNDQLAAAMSRHQRALLEARKRAATQAASSPPPLGGRPTSQPQAMTNGTRPRGNLVEAPTEFAQPPPGPPPGRRPTAQTEAHDQDPFGDDNESAADLEAPLSPQHYGLPPGGVAEHQDRQSGGYSGGYSETSGNGHLDNQAGTAGPSKGIEEAAPKPRYRF